MVISCFWILFECNFLYLYHVKGGLYVYMKPDVIIFVDIIFALIGLVLGYKTMKGQLNVKTGYTVILTGWIVGFIVEILI